MDVPVGFAPQIETSNWNLFYIKWRETDQDCRFSLKIMHIWTRENVILRWMLLSQWISFVTF